MNKKLELILSSITLNSEDEHRFGERAIKIIESSPILHDETNNFKNLREFINDTVEFLKIEIDYKSKYVPKIFHPNGPKANKFLIEIYTKVLNELSS